MKQKMSEEKYLKKCLEFLDDFEKDYSGDIIWINSGDLSCIMNPRSKHVKLFAGYSVWDVAEYVGKKLNKEVRFIDESY